ncbi:MAG TPA: hypothetical protein VG714_00795 [Acidobacteriaceae bacterium]|nr:hypothetical protein [Acidobacteriaceae bacterium]
MRAVFAAMATALAVLGAQTVRADSASEAAALYDHLAGAMKKCWFSGDPAFAAYRYSPEINAGVPRILLVEKKMPYGLPRLVVEPKRAGTADAYGPLLASALAPRIRDDLTRWLKGNAECSA